MNDTINKQIYLSSPHMGGNEMKYITEAFNSNWIAPLGINVNEFEREVCNYVDIKKGLALSSGTAGIHLALKYLGVGAGDYVFCSSLTFAASCNPIIYQNAIPVFIDSEPDTWNMSPVALKKAFEWALKENKIPKAVVVVDLYGQSADWDELIPICQEYNVPIVEDAAEALGATYKGRHCGTFGDIGIFSFNGNKIITTSGGGMVVSNNEEAIEKMFFWSTQARERVRHYEHREIGFNYRMSNICAGIGRGQLEILTDRIMQKKYIYKTYEEGLGDLPIKMMPIKSNGESNYWLSVLSINEPSSVSTNDIIEELEKNNIESRPVWKPLHIQPVFKDYQFFSHSDQDSISQHLFNTGLCLPSGTTISKDDLQKVINIIKKVFDR